MSQPLPHLPKPEFVLIPVEAPGEVPTQIAVDLGKTGIPDGLIGYEYRPLSKLVRLLRPHIVAVLHRLAARGEWSPAAMAVYNQ
ncbi:hypothetical protein [Streptomyces sp. NPDC097610]|uniref:hypothetical protein n=1 Tax=Streptomyces sp. NPDC097610 TaxID=3157227 RepID=UPI00332CFE89